MKLSVLSRRRRDVERPGVTGTVRLDRRTKNLTKRLRAGDVAVIDHADLDRVSAEALIDSGAVAVVNASRSISGRYPNLGPELLLEAGIPLVDGVGTDVFDKLHEGDRVVVTENRLYHGDVEVASGTEQDSASVADQMDSARAGLSAQLEAFTANTMDYLRRERDLLLDGVGVPDVTTKLDGRHALIVVRGYTYKEDLRALQHYIRENRPVLIGVDGGADALVEAGYDPDMIVGDMDSVSDRTLRRGAELIVHAYRDGHAPGADRLKRMGLDAVTFPATGTSEDVAMLLADSKGARLIVAVGTHNSLVEFLDKGRSGAASTFLIRMRVGGKLVDAKGVSRLYRSRIKGWQLAVLVLAGVFVFAMALTAVGGDQILWSIVRARWEGFVFWVRELFR